MAGHTVRVQSHMTQHVSHMTPHESHDPRHKSHDLIHKGQESLVHRGNHRMQSFGEDLRFQFSHVLHEVGAILRGGTAVMGWSMCYCNVYLHWSPW